MCAARKGGKPAIRFLLVTQPPAIIVCSEEKRKTSDKIFAGYRQQPPVCAARKGGKPATGFLLVTQLLATSAISEEMGEKSFKIFAGYTATYHHRVQP